MPDPGVAPAPGVLRPEFGVGVPIPGAGVAPVLGAVPTPGNAPSGVAPPDPPAPSDPAAPAALPPVLAPAPAPAPAAASTLLELKAAAIRTASDRRMDPRARRGCFWCGMRGAGGGFHSVVRPFAPPAAVAKLLCAIQAKGRFPFWLSSPPLPIASLKAGAFASFRDIMESPDAKRAGETGGWGSPD